MAEIIIEEKKIIVKIVYYGPALSGKTTNLMKLHDAFEGRQCGELMTFETKGDRTLFFDLLPLSVQCESGFIIKIKLFTVPGQVAHDATRKAVLSRADGVVFVADSQKGQAINNFESFDNLEKNICRVGLNLEQLPIIIQFNKRDLNNIVSEQEVAARWEPTGMPVIFSSALQGRGVLRTFRCAVMETYRYLDKCHNLKSQFDIDAQHFAGIIPN